MSLVERNCQLAWRLLLLLTAAERPHFPSQLSERSKTIAAIFTSGGGGFHGDATFGVNISPKLINKHEAGTANVGYLL